MGILKAVGGALLKGVVNFAVKALDRWMTKRKIEELGGAKARLAYEENDRKARDAMRRVGGRSVDDALDRLRQGEW